MKVELTDVFLSKLSDQIEFIALDKPIAARKFKNAVFAEIKKIPAFPEQHRKSIYFDNRSIRDLVFRGYTIVYRIDSVHDVIKLFGLVKHQKEI